MQHFATLHHTTPYCTSLHLSILHFLSFTLHYPLIWLNPFTFPTVPFHLTSLNYTQECSPIPKLISKIMNPFTALKNLSTFHFTSLIFFYFVSLILSHFTLLFVSTTHVPSLFTFYRFHFPSVVFTFVTLVLKICVLPWEIPVAPSGIWFQAVMDLFTKEYNK